MKKIKTETLVFCVLSALFCALLVLATFFDLDISRALVNLGEGEYYSRDLFGRFFETFGLLPLYIFVDIAAAIVFHYSLRRKKGAGRTAALIFAVVLCLAMSYHAFYKIFKYLSQHFGFEQSLGGFSDTAAYFLLGALLGGGVFYLTRKLSSAALNSLFLWAIVIMFAAAFSQLFTQSVKLFAGRARYRAMNVWGDFSEYTKWFEFCGKRLSSDVRLPADDVYKSFPSGHSASAAMFAVVAAFPFSFFKCGKKIKIFFYVFASAWIACTMITRITVGAHFASDVLVGCYSALSGVFLGDRFIKKLFTPLALKTALPETDEPRLSEEIIR